MRSIIEATPTTRVSAEDLEFRELIDSALARFIDQKVAEFPGGDQTRPLLAEVRAFVLAAGKRVRPRLCHLGWCGAGGDPLTPGIVTAAASFELFHAAALVHDDVMDTSDTRRGRPTLHRGLEPRDRAEAEWIGVCSAIIAGDLLWAWSDEMLRTSALPQAAVRAASPLVAVMRTEAMAGQYLDIDDPGPAGSWLDRAATVNLYKTARYTMVRPLQVGGRLAGAGKELLDVYHRVGEAMGLAFQLRDDVLGLFGDPAATGKSNTDDLRAGKRTQLIALAVHNATPAQVGRLRGCLGDPGLTDEQAASVRDVVVQTGALRLAEQTIADQTRTAIDLLRGAPIEPATRTTLIGLATALATRTA